MVRIGITSKLFVSTRSTVDRLQFIGLLDLQNRRRYGIAIPVLRSKCLFTKRIGDRSLRRLTTRRSATMDSRHWHKACSSDSSCSTIMWAVGYSFVVPAGTTLRLSFDSAPADSAQTSQALWDYFTVEYGEQHQIGADASYVTLEISHDNAGFNFLTYSNIADTVTRT